MNRKTLIAGNWKMHLASQAACDLAASILKACPQVPDREVMLAPPFTVLRDVSKIVAGSPIRLAGQNVCWEAQGAFTGEISPPMLRDCGASAAIVGHSERRQIFKENDALINNRLRGALSFGITAILCIGETEEERRNDNTFTVLESQVRQGLHAVQGEAMENVVIAYEPVWAIGTGLTASKEQAQEAHAFIRRLLENIFEKSVAEQTRILYGGSVKPANVDELMNQPDIDGALVGGAALDAESFGRIMNFE